VLRRLWTEDLVTFNGRFHTLESVNILPAPVQKRKRCLGGTFRCARGRVMFEADARASTHVDFRA
jgi:alkanesulfonate monooxygenase SsuD/methylene tetrahydromethanopterin reductase-like flavin-dependent oxidoreductase (luciferase family)